MNAPSFSNLRLKLHNLKEDAALQALKTGTEIEDMNFEEIAFLRGLTKDIVPLYVKIGGPEARNDIRELIHIGVDALIAPMIESVYALQKFIQSLQELLEPAQYRSIKKGINIETIDAFHKLDEILSAAQTYELDQITAARSDLSASMQSAKRGEREGEQKEFSANDAEVIANCALIVKGAQEYGIQTSVGGQIEPLSITELLRYVQPDFVNSRHMLLCSRALQEHPRLTSSEIIIQNLSFECSLYSHLMELFPAKKEHYKKRILALTRRMQKKEVPQTPKAALA